MRNRFTCAASYSGPTLQDGGTVSVVCPNGARIDHVFSHAGSAHDIVGMINRHMRLDVRAIGEVSRAVLSAVLIAQKAFYSGGRTDVR